jgi:restriction endonuclease S subunit
MNTPELVGECCFVQETHENIFLPDRLWQTRFYSSSKLNIKWLNYLLNSSEYKFRIKSTATGTSNSMKNISKEVFLTLPYKQPTNNEQLKIATILSVWDDAILQTQNLIFQLKQRDKILSEKLLLGTIRLPGFKNQWIEVPLGKVFSERVETNRISLPLLSITADRGVILQSEGTKKTRQMKIKLNIEEFALGILDTTQCVCGKAVVPFQIKRVWLVLLIQF